MTSRGANLTVDRFDTTLYSGLLADALSVIPAGSTLEAPLLRIAVAAAQVNVILDRRQFHNAGDAWASANFLSASTELVNSIAEAVREFDRAFGPLQPER